MEELNRIRKSIENEDISYGEIVFLSEHQKEVLKTGDIVLAEWAGIPEEEFIKAQEQTNG